MLSDLYDDVSRVFHVTFSVFYIFSLHLLRYINLNLQKRKGADPKSRGQKGEGKEDRKNSEEARHNPFSTSYQVKESGERGGRLILFITQ